ncbi:MAG TPA: ABC transporter permease [Terriglobales bacterium]|nr:ABC transporter permease [Terriglobales bacterium]
MIGPVVRTSLLNLRRDRSALLLTFVLPVAFFSIFAVIFGTQRREGTPRIHVAIADHDHSRASQRLIAGLQAESSLIVLTAPKQKEKSDAQKPAPFTAETAEAAVRQGDVPVALIIPKGFGESPIAFGPARADQPVIQLLKDSSDPIAPQVVSGLLQKAAMTSMPDVMAEQGTKYVDQFAGGLTSQQRNAMNEQIERLRGELNQQQTGGAGGSTTGTSNSEDAFGGLIAVDSRDVIGETKKNPIVAFYAAAIGVMFLMFSASGAGGVLLEEVESGTLDRVLSSRVNMLTLLAGKLVFLTCVGIAQLTVMFVWGALVFKLELLKHLDGFIIMAVVTALATSALGMVFAAASRSRAQLGAMSTLVILVMSALGGSMFPRFIMPESLQKAGLVTLNAWAIDGFTKIFWRDEPLTHLWPQVAVLLCIALVLFFVARQLVRRWEYS